MVRSAALIVSTSAILVACGAPFSNDAPPATPAPDPGTRDVPTLSLGTTASASIIDALSVVAKNYEDLQADQFTTTKPLEQFLGKEVEVKLAPSVRYDEGVLEVSEFPNPVLWRVDGRSRLDNGIALGESSEPLGAYTGSNAYGVEKVVDKTYKRSWTVILTDGDKLFSYNTKMTVPPEEGRTLKDAFTFRIRGKLVKGPNGEAAECYLDSTSPTIIDPNEKTERSCFVWLQPTAADFVTSDGRIIKATRTTY